MNTSQQDEYLGDGSAERNPEVRISGDGSTGLHRDVRVIRSHLEGIEAGRAARRIHEQKRYEELGFRSLEAFLEAEFGIGRSRWYQLLAGIEVYDILADNQELIRDLMSTQVESVRLPQVLAWTRPLHGYKDDPELLCLLYANVLDQIENPTRRKIRDLVDELTDDEEEDTGSGETKPLSGGDGPGGDGPDGNGSESPESGGDEPEESDDESDGEESDEDEEESDEGDDGGDDDVSDDGDESEDEQSEDGEKGSESSPLDRARQQYAPLLDDLNTGVAEGILQIAEVMSGGAPERSHVRTARENFEGLGHRKLDDDEADRSDARPQVFGCLIGSIDPVDDRDVLISTPRVMVSKAMAKRAVPIGTPTLQHSIGVPLSFFGDRPPIDDILATHGESGRQFTFNRTSVQVDWASYTINPITGCLHTCGYCYARYQAEELNRYKQGFHPTFYPERLLAFSEMTPPDEVEHIREKNVFLGSMSDVYGKWVPDWMIQRILDEVEATPAFNFLFLTKFPQKLSRFDFPDNAWVGTTVDRQRRVTLAQKYFEEVEASVKWLSCEPMLDRLDFDDLAMFDCVVIGAQKAYGTDIEEEQPEFDWVIDLYQAAREAGCKVYFKENLDLDYPKELPTG